MIVKRSLGIRAFWFKQIVMNQHFLLWYREKLRNELVNLFKMQFNWKISDKQQLIDAPSSQIYLYSYTIFFHLFETNTG